ncbi:hypothetical protein [Flavilitoribacter nigricans]|uniref:hypothetical protein n=1 Tax=Flavilitoribacter nigricans TaxID=70997 RepID=UPI000C04253A|nr:hypothetical protein [Flavilitoribacter nigricans]
MNEFHRKAAKTLSLLEILKSAKSLSFAFLTVEVAKIEKFADANFFERRHCKTLRLCGLGGEDKHS